MTPILCPRLAVLAAACAGSALALAQPGGCRIEPFQGATSPQGAVVRMRVVNAGRSCDIVNFGAPAERSNPADSGTITQPPAHGKAEFEAPRARYTPERGYVGDDAFEYEAFARGSGGQRVRLKVRVEVDVVAARGR